MFDGLALALTGVCGVQCLLLPVLLIFFPILGGSIFMQDHFHLWLLAGILPAALIAVFLGCRRHKDKWVMGLSVVGLSVLMLAALFGHDLFGHETEKWITLSGGLIMAIAHIRNFRLCRKVDCCHS